MGTSVSARRLARSIRRASRTDRRPADGDETTPITRSEVQDDSPRGSAGTVTPPFACTSRSVYRPSPAVRGPGWTTTCQRPGGWQRTTARTGGPPGTATPHGPVENRPRLAVQAQRIAATSDVPVCRVLRRDG